MKKSNHYVNNKTLYLAMVDYKKDYNEAVQSEKPLPQIPNYIGECIFHIANKLSLKGNFINYSYREEMVSDGIENCINYINNFDPDRYQNPFAYFTKIIWNAFVLRIQKEKKQTYIKYKSFENSSIMDELSNHSDSDEPISINVSFNDNMNDFVREYEKKLKIKKPTKKIGLDNFVEGDSNE